MEKQCQRCGNTFQSKRNTRKFCSETCKQYEYLIRHGLNLPRLHVVKSGSEMNKNQSDVGKTSFKQPQIIKWIEEVINQQNHLDVMIYRADLYWGRDQGQIIKWVNVRMKCILHNLIRLSYKPVVFPATLSALYEAMGQLVNSGKYKLLSDDYPYKLFIRQLSDKIRQVKEQSLHYSEIKFPLSQRTKAEFIAILYNLSWSTPLKKFGELTFY